MATLRTDESEAYYQEILKQGILEKGCPLCGKETMEGFNYWKIIENDFPYDKIAKTHHMLVPKRHVAEDGITKEEWAEFQEIKKDYLNEQYEYFIEAAKKKRSIPEHFHLHLLIAK